MSKVQLELIIERGDDSKLSGRVTYNDNLIVEFADDVAQLDKQMKRLLKDFEELDPEAVEFVYLYDVYAIFDRFDFLNISKIAKHAGINPGLLRQYASGVKHPSAAQAKKIEDTIHHLAQEMNKALVYAE